MQHKNNRTLTKYVQICSELKYAKENRDFYLCNVLNTPMPHETYFFSSIKQGNKIKFPEKMNFFFKNNGNKYIYLLENGCINLIKNEFSGKAPGKLLDFFKEIYVEVKCVKTKTTLKLRKKTTQLLNLKKGDFIVITVFHSGMFIKKLKFAE